MTKVPILYYSAYGHTERMAQAVADGVREAGAQVDIKRVPELVPDSPKIFAPHGNAAWKLGSATRRSPSTTH
jgi:flavodoxin